MTIIVGKIRARTLVGEAAQIPAPLTKSLFLLDCLTEPECLLSRHEDNISADLHATYGTLNLHFMQALTQNNSIFKCPNNGPCALIPAGVRYLGSSPDKRTELTLKLKQIAGLCFRDLDSHNGGIGLDLIIVLLHFT